MTLFKNQLQHRCYRFSLSLIRVIDTLPNKRPCWVIADQLIRSGTSVGANLIEATSASSKRDFKHYHEISLKSANETRYWLMLLKDSRLTLTTEVDALLKEISEIANIIAAGILTMKGKRRV